jgi:hypothetical protein
VSKPSEGKATTFESLRGNHVSENGGGGVNPSRVKIFSVPWKLMMAED